MNSIKNIFSYLLRIGLSAALLGYLLHKTDVQAVVDAFRNADPQYMGYALIAFFAIHIFLLVRWTLIMHALGLNFPWAITVQYFFIGLFFNLFLPTSTGGDLVKTLGLCRYTDQKAKVVASVVLDRLSGFAGIVLVALMSYLIGRRMMDDNSLLISIGFLGVTISTILFVLFNETLYSFGCRLFNRWPKIKTALMSLHYDIALLKNRKKAFFAAIGISSMSQIVLSLTFFFVAKAMHQDIPFGYFLIFVPLICIIGSLPSIGGLGVRDAGAVYLFAKIGIASSTAVSITLINFFFMVLIGLIGGVIYVTSLSPGRLQYHQGRAGAGG